ncbi:MAG: L,D-transpeptidase [Gaiellaceae bacterium]
MTRLRLRVAALALIASAVVAPSAARAAEPALSAPAAGIDWLAGTVTIAADYPAGTSKVFFSVSGQPLATVAVADPTVAGTVSSGVPYRLATPTRFGADFLDARGASLGVTKFGLSPATFTPSTPRLSLPSGSIVAPSYTLQAEADQTVTGVKVAAGPEPLTRQATLSSGADGHIRLSDLRVPYGGEQLRLTASNGFGASPPSRAKTVFSLGPLSKLPERANYVLVDKRSMTLYDVRKHLVVRHYDITIGTPSTPTPNGYFKLGAARPASGAWGVLRRPLYRFSRTRSWPSGFYIHGTDAPWDIGTWASHGCVRLYNWAIREFTKIVPSGTLVLIRK